MERGSEAGRVLRAVKALERRSHCAPNRSLKHLKTRIFALTLTQTLSNPLEAVHKWAFGRLQSGLFSPEISLLSSFPPLLKPIFNVVNRKRVADSIAVKHAAVSLGRVAHTASSRLVEAGFCAIRWKSCLSAALSRLESRAKASRLLTLKQGMLRWQLALLCRNNTKPALKAAALPLFPAFPRLFAVQKRQLQACWERLRKASPKDFSEAGKRLIGRVQRLFERRILRTFWTLQQAKSANKDSKATFLRLAQICDYKRLSQLIYAFSSVSAVQPERARGCVAALLRGVLSRLVWDRLRLALGKVRVCGIRWVRKVAKLRSLELSWRKRTKKAALRRWESGVRLPKGLARLLKSIKDTEISMLSRSWSKIKANFKSKSSIKQAFDRIELSKPYTSLINLQIKSKPQRKSDWERTCRRRVVKMMGVWAGNWQKQRVRKSWE